MFPPNTSFAFEQGANRSSRPPPPMASVAAATPLTAGCPRGLLSTGFRANGDEMQVTPAWVCMLSRFSCVWLFANPWTVARQAPLSMGFSRQGYWSGWPCPPPGDLSDPGVETAFPALQADSFLLLSQQGCPGDPRLDPGSRVSTSCPRSCSPGSVLRPLRVARDAPAALLCSQQCRGFSPDDRDGPDPGPRDGPSLMPASVSAAGDAASRAEASLSTIAEPLEQAGHRGVA